MVVNQAAAPDFRQIYREKRTGLLLCEGDSVRRAVSFSYGFIVGARSTRKEDRRNR